MIPIEEQLDTLYQDAKKDYLRIGKGILKSVLQLIQPADFKNAYLPISKEQGEAIRQLVINNNCINVVEFGTSFGISTIYLADAVRQTGGKVISTELLESKATRAKENIKNAGLNEFVDIRIGDAMETLKNHTKPIDFLFLDGWKDLYLPLFQLLEPQFHSGTMIYADNMDMQDTKPYADFILNQKKYNTELLHKGKAFLTTVNKS